MWNTHKKLKQRIFKRDNYTCQLKLVPECAGNMHEAYFAYLKGQKTRRKVYLTVDHIIPVSKGGEWKTDNFQCACFPCNRFKGVRI